MKNSKVNRIIITVMTCAILLSSFCQTFAYYNPTVGRFNRLDPYEGELKNPQSLHKYNYCQNDPVNRIDPTGKMGTMTETLTVQAITVEEIGISLWATWMVYNAVNDTQNNIDNRAAQHEIEMFLQTNPDPFTQYQFEQLENRIRTVTRHRQNDYLYLFYGHQEHLSSIYSGLRAPAYLTRDAYQTGWEAKMKLAQFNGGPRNSVFFILPNRSTVYGPNKVLSRPDQYIQGLLLPGGGNEYIAPNGTGPGSVIGHLPIPIGNMPHF